MKKYFLFYLFLIVILALACGGEKFPLPEQAADSDGSTADILVLQLYWLAFKVKLLSRISQQPLETTKGTTR